MILSNVSLAVLGAILVLLVALFVMVRSFRLPKSYYKNERERAAMRMRQLDKDYERTKKTADSFGDRAKNEDDQGASIEKAK